VCFSAEASFGASAALMPVGIYCVGQAARKEPRKLALAVIPIVFSIQQFCEGVLWLELHQGPARPDSPAALAFLFFALWFWPVWAPLNVAYFLRRPPPALLLLLASGIALGTSLYAPILSNPERYLSIVVRHSIRYEFGEIPILGLFPEPVLRAAYLAIIVVPCGFCDRRLKLFGLAVLASSILSQVVFGYAFYSIWCLFAALLSLLLGLYFAWPSRAQGTPSSRAAAATGDP
jgi:hypothetical protein